MSYLSSSSSSSDFTDSDFSTPGTTRRRRYGRIYESDTSSEDSWSDDTSDEMTKRVRFCSPLPRSNNGCNIRTQRIPVSADISSPATRTDIGSGFGDRGQLKLVICGTARKLTVTFLGVRSLHKSYTRSGSYPHYIYLKISLSPDTENRVRHKTSPKCLTSDTLSVHESFSFDITRRDIGKRILISAWSKCEAYDRSMFIGCMSFGVKRIVSNQEVIQGWYYFLSEILGRKKHLTAKVIHEPQYSDNDYYEHQPLKVQTLPSRRKVQTLGNIKSSHLNNQSSDSSLAGYAKQARQPRRKSMRSKRSFDDETKPFKRIKLTEDIHTTVHDNASDDPEPIAVSSETTSTSYDVITRRRHNLGKKYTSTDLLLFRMSYYGNHEESSEEDENLCSSGLPVELKETRSAKIISQASITAEKSNENEDFVNGNLVETRCSARVAKRRRLQHLPDRRCVSSYVESHPEEIIIKIAQKLSGSSVQEPILEHDDRGYHSGATSTSTSCDSSSDESKPVNQDGDYVYLSGDPTKMPWDDKSEQKIPKNESKFAEIKKCTTLATNTVSEPSIADSKGKQTSIQNLKNWFNRKADDAVFNSREKSQASPKTINPPKSISTGWLLKYKAAENHVFRQLKRTTSLRKTEVKTCEHCVYSSQTLAEVLKRKGGATAFRIFLESEFSDENIHFYLDVEAYKQVRGGRRHKMATKIFEQYLIENSPSEVNIDAKTRAATKSGLASSDSSIFDLAQERIFKLMETDSFRRFQISEFRKCKCSSR
nr:uncharacterized protein LOC100182918 isoform X1 [Ciona intestinalis]XP_018666742.1 uncharacterized protein LOC100182918 isoform X2 [Ciona intestinalis]|eukprot:XP_018666741.1 uncharacterized protein LOC100182918 isoform X1 [Ciona intestinalis]